ncbi:STM4014 family protein [Massilia sp. CCM 9210]|uniref:STM4014 family protein n=1 Tax=Massilia scottii TaxID=3057166 RepID=UPI002796624C|nr:STM4014 family protein [Massilia sp. CCM 9210]MDQ1812226.1 STM4014 family protein [Massilia sp. CCM 9210]
MLDGAGGERMPDGKPNGKPNGEPLVLLGVRGGKREKLMQAARQALGLPAAVVVDWAEWLDQPALLTASLAQRPCVFKIDSPGDDARLHGMLIRQGCKVLGIGMSRLPDLGEISVSGEWFSGFTQALQRVAAELSALPHVKVMNAPHELLLMTDKLACQQHFAARGIPIPRLLGPIEGYAHLRAVLDEHHLNQVFLKTRYGSSASGVVAYRRNSRGAEQATSSADLVQGEGGPRLYNVKRLRSYNAQPDIVQLVDLLAGQETYAEAWIPKPRHGDGHYDVRVVTLGGQPAHRVARVGTRMMTNLHLDNQRADVASLLGEKDHAALEQTARAAAATFSQSHVIGLDIVVRKGHAHVLEANAFGDLLPKLLWQGHDTYAAQLQSFSSHEA